MGELTNASRKPRALAAASEQPGAPRPLAKPAGLSKASSPQAMWIGKELRRLYGRALQEPVPQRFLDLLDELDKKASQ